MEFARSERRDGTGQTAHSVKTPLTSIIALAWVRPPRMERWKKKDDVGSGTSLEGGVFARQARALNGHVCYIHYARTMVPYTRTAQRGKRIWNSTSPLF